MSELRLLVTSSPHIRAPETTAGLMRKVVEALALAMVAAVYFFGLYALALVAVSVAAAVVSEALWQKVNRRPVMINDWSAVVTGLLVAFNVPPRAPLWLPIIGTVFAVIVVKQLFGGLGNNIVNPALAARAFMLTAWPAQMTGWVAPFSAVTAATPLPILLPKGQEIVAALPGYMDLLLGNTAGCLGETSALALLIGGVYLIWHRVIDWRIPVGFLGTLGVLAWTLGGQGLFGGDFIYHLLAGGVMLGAFYMATDYVTSPMTAGGRLLMGIGCGLITFLIRVYGGFPEGVSYSILLMNIATPLIDRFLPPKRFGGVTS